MTHDQVRQRIYEIGIVPVVRAASPEEALDAASAIREGGLAVLEITMTVPGALDVIRELARRHRNDALVGAGSVKNAAAARACLDAGAQFLVSPGLDDAVVKLATEAGVVSLPGVLTPSEVMRAAALGASTMKLFPISNLGGPAYMKALKAPFPEINFVPTGGVNINNAAEYFAAGAFALGLGGDLVDLKALRAGDRGKIVEGARRLAEVAQKFRAGEKAPLAASRA
ncbi:MAG TPA: bifunctional 4-hydroxy-2-oxoglutarate aldolase/2-dehydro-3-deoxy-phosphogluconate aldolase [Terriglobales bacterium]|nr:bifunctional 4-hydroxy-2-oxoglutarate aldolase/2-dehydro-3-deoxy-phosphogluconate aldolase [Terriglobales bacterium]